ncbi:MAG: hypothetical protein ACNA78_04460, partial [Balneolaceae bacterium]
MSNRYVFLWAVTALLVANCGSSDRDSDTSVETEPPAHVQFYDALAQHCGNAYPGGLTLEPPGDEMLTGTEMLVVHFRECSDEQLKLPFHIELEEENDWDRSRTWIFTKHSDGLELRHDHRKRDGSEDEVTMYGGLTVGSGSAIRQEFQSIPRSEETGMFRGWRLEIEPGVRYTYGTIRDTTWSWRVDFDLTEPLT